MKIINKRFPSTLSCISTARFKRMLSIWNASNGCRLSQAWSEAQIIVVISDSYWLSSIHLRRLVNVFFYVSLASDCGQFLPCSIVSFDLTSWQSASIKMTHSAFRECLTKVKVVRQNFIQKMVVRHSSEINVKMKLRVKKRVRS